MTVAPHEGGGTVALPDDLDSGLEDFGMDDAAVPRLQIVHKEGVFKDSMSGETFREVNVIILGLVRQRVMWEADVQDGDVPQCKSTDFETGYPNQNEDGPRRLRFPWNDAGFDPKDYPINPQLGLAELPCSSCALKDWGTHADGKRPACTEQFTFPVLYDPSGEDEWVPAIMTFQKTGIKPTKQYLGSFHRSKKPPYTVHTTIKLDQQRRGTTDYSVPQFFRGDPVDENQLRMFSEMYGQLREFLRQPPRPPEGSDAPGAQKKKEDAPAAKTAQQAAPTSPPADDAPADTVDAEVVEEPKDEPQAQTPPPAAAAPSDDLPF